MLRKLMVLLVFMLVLVLNSAIFADGMDEEIEDQPDYDALKAGIKISEPITPYYISPNGNINIIINIDESIQTPVYVTLYQKKETLTRHVALEDQVYDKLNVSLTKLKPIDSEEKVTSIVDEKNITDQILMNDAFSTTTDESEAKIPVVLKSKTIEKEAPPVEEAPLKVEGINAYYDTVHKLESVDAEIEDIYEVVDAYEESKFPVDTRESLTERLNELKNEREDLIVKEEALRKEYNKNFREKIFQENIVTYDKMRNYYRIEKDMPQGNYILTLEDETHHEFYSMPFDFRHKD